MKDLIISLESTCDLTQKQIKEHDLRVIDMMFMVDGKEYSTATDTVVTSELYSKMKSGKKTLTSQINEATYFEFFEQLLKEGKDILHLAFSSGLSNTVNCAKKAAEELNKTHENKIYVIDTLCGCSGQGFLGILTRRYSKKAESIDQAVRYVENLKHRLNHCFSVENLKYLANGGRIKASTAFIGNLLNIKPVMRMDEEGRLVSCGKVMSRKKSLVAIFDKLKNTYDQQFDMCFISHADCLQDAEFIAKLVQEQTTLKPYITDLGPIIGSHSGPGTISLYFIGQQGR